MSCEALIEARGLTKVYGRQAAFGARLFGRRHRAMSADAARPAVSSVDLDVFAGETIGILGHNGAGKTTLLSMISGVLKPTNGVVKRRGSLVPLLGVGTSFMPELSGRENAEFNLLTLGVPRREACRRLREIEAFADIGHHFDAPLWTYSSGMVARVAFAAALQVDADAFIIDETLSVGDAAFREKCAAAIRELQRSRRTFLLVSHTPLLISKMCTRALVLDKGRKVFDGAPAEAIRVYDEIVAAAARRKVGAQVLPGASDDEIGVVIDEFAFSIDDIRGTSTGVVRLTARAREAVERPLIALSVRGATGVVLARMPFAPIAGCARMESGAQTCVEIRFSQRLLPGSYVCDASIAMPRGESREGEPTILASRSFRIDIRKPVNVAAGGYIDLDMQLKPVSSE